ncbi:MAG: flagellar hook-length control protein FliK, partial [Magnetospirillum sp.]|nr:flagellar hook-length control protein FliK [Magnetospirillum sp.]
MTVQSIDKRVVPEANMSSVTQDKQQTAQSVEDAFVSLLHQTTQRFANKAANTGTMSADKVLSDVVTHQHIEIKIDAKAAARNDAKDDKAAATKDPRAIAKADKPKQAQADAPAAKKADDDNGAPVVQNDDDTKAQAASDDDKSGTANAKDDDGKSGQDDKVQTAKQPEAVAVVAQQEQVIVEIDITVEEKVSLVETDTSGQAAAIDPAALAQAVSAQLNGTQDDTKQAGNDLMASLSADDRQRISDLEKRIVSDVADGNADDALDAATELVSQLVAKVNKHVLADNSDLHATAQSDAAADQAQDLAAMLGAS